ncbi:MAG: hypothetical protein K6T78_03825 [Alicyclobacillus sp.]|nr:hypothetical protein [Alicyclobacillus sp.]
MEAFLDAATAVAIDWPRVWAWFAPVTPFGRDAKSALAPFLPGDEVACAEALRQLAADCAEPRLWQSAQLEDVLRRLPDIRPALAVLENDATTLQPRDCLVLKQFLWFSDPLLASDRMPACSASTRMPAWTDVSRWRALRALFGPGEEPTFRVEELGDVEVDRAASALLSARRMHLERARADAEAWRERAGVRPNRDGQLVLPLPAARERAEALLGDPGLRWLRDTPFERVFEVVPSPELAAAEARLADAQARLADAEARALSIFTAKLRRHLDDWRQVLADVTQLDLRRARVLLQQRLRGSVPHLTPHGWRMDGLVDPLAQHHLEQHGERFAPVNLDLPAGVTVVTGPNMSGKSVTARAACLCQALAQFGLPVPAQQVRTRLFDAVRFVAEAATDVDRGLSAFGGEVVRLAAILRAVESGRRWFLCLDEPLRTTHPLYGEALLVAVVEALHETMSTRGVALVVTHFTAPLRLPQVAVHTAGVWQGEPRTPLEVAASLGFPESVLGRAKALGTDTITP